MSARVFPAYMGYRPHICHEPAHRQVFPACMGRRLKQRTASSPIDTTNKSPGKATSLPGGLYFTPCILIVAQLLSGSAGPGIQSTGCAARPANPYPGQSLSVSITFRRPPCGFYVCFGRPAIIPIHLPDHPGIGVRMLRGKQHARGFQPPFLLELLLCHAMQFQVLTRITSFHHIHPPSNAGNIR